MALSVRLPTLPHLSKRLLILSYNDDNQNINSHSYPHISDITSEFHIFLELFQCLSACQPVYRYVSQCVVLICMIFFSSVSISAPVSVELPLIHVTLRVFCVRVYTDLVVSALVSALMLVAVNPH